MNVEQVLKSLTFQKPIVHHITNYVTVNDCANIVLASGGAPIMADDVAEVQEITSIANALVLNLGTLNQRTIESMLLAGIRANEIGIPVILDPVGVGASTLRHETTLKLLNEVSFAVIRGNVSEMKRIGQSKACPSGVDASEEDYVSEENLDEMVAFAKSLSASLNSIIVMTGAMDVVASSTKAFVIRNGHAKMAYITGTGCMLSSVIGVFSSANPNDLVESCCFATAFMGRCGEVAYQKMKDLNEGYSSMKMYLIDAMSQLEEDCIKGGLKIESRG